MVGTPSNSSILRIVVVGLCVLAPTLYIHMVFSTFVPCDQRVDQRFMRRKQLKPFIPINSSQHLRYRRQQAYYYLGCTRRTYSTVGISFQRNALSLSLSEQQHVSFGYLTLDFRYDPPFLLVAPRIVYLNLRAGLIGMRQLRGAEPIIYCTGRHQFRDISNGIMNVILRFLVTLSRPLKTIQYALLFPYIRNAKDSGCQNARSGAIGNSKSSFAALGEPVPLAFLLSFPIESYYNRPRQDKDRLHMHHYYTSKDRRVYTVSRVYNARD